LRPVASATPTQFGPDDNRARANSNGDASPAFLRLHNTNIPTHYSMESAIVVHRPALALRPSNAGLSPSNTRSVSGTKRTRDDEDAEDIAETRGSAKRARVDVDVKTPKLDKAVEVPIPKVNLENKPIAVTATAKKRSDKEKSRAARQAAEEDFRLKYRNAFPAWTFYFDGVPSGAVVSATRKIQALGAVSDML
jgi:hypothetical protein